MSNLIEMSYSDIKKLKEKLWLENNGKCPLLGIEIPLDKIVLDHIHKLKSEDPSEQKGTIRNAIEFRANSIEGRISNSWKRYFGADINNHPIDLPTFLRNLADYLEEGAYSDSDGNYYIHPTEIKKEPKLSKRVFNKIAKLYREEYPKRKPLEYPKSGKATKKIKELSEKYKISLEK